MERNALRLAQLYAQAFMHVFASEFTRSEYKKIEQLLPAQEKMKALSLLAALPISHEKKIELLQGILKKYDLVAPMYTTLIKLLLKQKRMVLLPLIVREIMHWYKEGHNIATFKISSSQALSSSELALVEKFLAHKTGKDIEVAVGVDPSLIAGVRLQSDELLYEDSVEKKLRSYAPLHS